MIWDITIHNIHKEEVLFSLECILKEAIKNFEIKVDIQLERQPKI